MKDVPAALRQIALIRDHLHHLHAEREFATGAHRRQLNVDIADAERRIATLRKEIEK